MSKFLILTLSFFVFILSIIITVQAQMPTITGPSSATICSGGTVGIPLTSNVSCTYVDSNHVQI